MQGIILPPHLATKLFNDVLRRWSQYFNRCVAASASKVVKALGASIPLSLKPILVELEGGSYIDLILLFSLDNLVAGKW